MSSPSPVYAIPTSPVTDDYTDAVVSANFSILIETTATALNEPIGVGVSIQVKITQVAVEVVEIAGAPVERRLLPSTTINLPSPAFVTGRPTLPMWRGIYTTSHTLNVGPAHIHSIPDPNPVWDPNTNGWSYPPPFTDGAGHVRWSVRDLPNPNDHGGMYWLGHRTSLDSTLSLPDSCEQWAPSGGSAGWAPSWNSVFPYKPSVWNHVHYGPTGNIETQTAAVRFNTHYVEHMWIDLNGHCTPPLTWIIVGMIMHYDFTGQNHYILDSGVSPVSSGLHLGAEISGKYNAGADPRNYRQGLRVSANQLIAFNDHTIGSHTLRTPHIHNYKPHMFFVVNNGTHSIAGNYAAQGGKQIKTGTLSTPGAMRYVMMGRENGVVAKTNAAHLVVFEIRYWTRALSQAEIQSQYDQLSSSWQFHKYK